ncbi:MAG: hypothetical protein KDL87_02160, partial [Verrucomicrobiae bacterium]|nr:hypothetical protein [Verrucomicrobiae bacterium]
PHLPLIVAVTGHRELHPDDLPRLRDQIQAFFQDLKKKYPHTPILLLSALGPGADRFAAREALNCKGVSLAAVLPWPEGACDAERHRGGDPTEFEALLDRAIHRICLPLPDGADPATLCDSIELQQRCFENVGHYLTRHCQILAAIWNGLETEDSQTWQVIRWHLEGCPAPFAPDLGHLDEPETGPLIHFPARRGTDDALIVDAGPKRRPPSKDDNTFDGVAAHFERFNADIHWIGPCLSDGLAQAKGYVFPEPEQAALMEPQRFILDRFAMADQLSAVWQRRTLRAFLGVLGLIFLMVASFECYAHLAPGRLSLLVGYPVIFGIGWGLVFWGKRLGIYNRYLDNRALAEALRVHLFWKLAGLPQTAADYYLRSYRSQLDWIRAALRSWTVQSGEHDCRHACPVEGPPDAATLDQIRERWMADQQGFFAKNKVRDHHRAHTCHWWAWGFLSVSLAATLIQSGRLWWAYRHHDHQVGHDGTTHAFIMIIAMGGVLAGLCHEYLEKRLFEKQSRSYASMDALYQTALNRFDALRAEGDATAIQSLLRELGREALAENADWVIYHREHEPTMRGH